MTPCRCSRSRSPESCLPATPRLRRRLPSPSGCRCATASRRPDHLSASGRSLGSMDSTPRVGIVGAGGIAPPHIEGWLALGADVGILRRTGADALAERYGIRIHDSLDALLDASEIVDIVSPTPSHPEIAQAAFDRGRHVVCEKPLAVTASEAQAMTDAASAAGVRLFPAHVVRYFD